LSRLAKHLLLFVVLVGVLFGMLSRDDAVRDWWQRGQPPHPNIMPSAIAAWRLNSVPLDDQFAHSFYYGEECGRLLGLQGAAERGADVPRDLRAHFFDGVGHGFEPPDDIMAAIDEIEAHVPDQYLTTIHDGVLRHYTLSQKGDPAKVVPFAERFTRVSGLTDPYNGVRIGLQRALGHQLPEALNLATSYPETYWPALFEELGWRASRHRPPRAAGAPANLADDDTYWAAAMAWVQEHLEFVPESMHCHYLHGAIRGRALGYPWQDRRGWIRLQDEIDGLGTRCRKAAYQGIGWGIYIQTNHRPNRVHTMLESISDQAGREVAENTYSEIVLSLSGPGHEPLTLWNLERLDSAAAEDEVPEAQAETP